MSDRARAALGAAVQDEARSLPYSLCYPCEVLKDWGDMTLDLLPDDADLLPSLEKISLRVGIPGVRVKLKEGARVWLAFDNAEADKPLCYLFETGQLERFELTTGLGQSIVVEDDRGATSDEGSYAAPSITVTDASGNQIQMSKGGMAITSALPIAITTPMLTYKGKEVAVNGDLTTDGATISI